MENFTSYVGQLNSHQKPHGRGKMTWKLNGDTYEGEFKSGLPDGRGTMVYAVLGNTYHGEFSKGLRHGTGYMNLINGDQICGNFKQDLLTGFAVIYYANGDFFEGLIKNNVKHGEGIIRYANGQVYYGDFFNNYRHGIGRIVEIDGVQGKQGSWRFDQFTGRGKVTKYAGNSGILTVFEGKFVNGMIHGDGVSTDSLGIYYKGEFKDGLMHGPGELLIPHGGRFVGEFKYNDFKKGKAETPDRTVSYGSFYNFSPDGLRVRVAYTDGAEYYGSMKQGLRTGVGKYTTKTGIKTTAYFSSDSIQGDSLVTHPTGIEYKSPSPNIFKNSYSRFGHF
jgi:hypothetical protein